jgi:LemA protein
MKRKTRNIIIVLVAVAVVILLIARFIVKTYDSAVAYDEQVKAAWGNVESAYQRRADLIPSLVNTVKGVRDYEKETLVQVIEARAKATSINIDPSKMNVESLQAFQQAQGALSSALSRLMVVVERYPELKANQNFLELQAQLEGTENRINVARINYNESVKTYNSHIRGLVKRWALNIAGGEFETKGSFTAEQGSEIAPKVEF